MFDFRSLALFRISLGCFIAVDAVFLACDSSAFMGDDGLFPRHVLWHVIPKHFGMSVLAVTGDGDLVLRALLLLLGAFALMFAAGYATTRSGLVCWFLLSSAHVRNFEIKINEKE